MNSLDLMIMGLRNLWRRKTRTILTVLGVVIGTSSIIVMLSLGFGMQRATKAQLEQMGSLTVIEVIKPYTQEFEDSSKSGLSDDQVYLDDEAIDMFKNIEHVNGILASKRVQMMLKVGKKQSWSEVNAVEFESLRQFGFELEEGNWPDEMERGAIVAGALTSANFYDPTSNGYYGEEPEPVDLIDGSVKFYINGEFYGEGKKKRPSNIDVVGILKGTDSWEDNKSYISLYAYEQILKDDNRKYGNKDDNKRKRGNEKVDKYDQLKVKVDDVENVMTIIENIRSLGYEAYGMAEYIESEGKQTIIIQAILGGIGGVSLLIAAIGITNTMIMSIYERTREIGVMKVLGAKLSDIKNLFLFESAMIGLLGGIVGSMLSYGVSAGINKIFFKLTENEYMVVEEISYIPVLLVLSALVFSALIGVISGYYPARRAMKLSALEAISTN